jgi:hypothetical protein
MFARMLKQKCHEEIFPRIVIIVGIISFTYLLLLTQIFFMERTCFADMSFILFYIVKDLSLSIQVNRFGSAVTQIFPLVGVWFNLSLETIMRLYSAAPIIWYSLVFLICVFVFRKPKHGLMMLLFAILMVADSFYWITNEQLQGTAFIILLFAFIEWSEERKISRYIFYPFLLLGILTAAFFHPLVIAGFIYFCCYSWLKTRKRIWIISGIIFCCFYTIKLSFFTLKTYDNRAFLQLKNLFDKLNEFSSFISTQNFFNYFIQHYYFWFIGLIVCSVYFLRKKNYLQLALLNGLSLVYLFVVLSVNANNNLKFYVESHLLLLGFFVSVPLCFEIFPSIKKPAMLISILGFGLMIRCAEITFDHKPFTQRLEWLENFQQQTENLPYKKLILSDSLAPMDTLMMTWGSPYESWLISSYNNPKNARSILIDSDAEKFAGARNENKSFVTQWGIFPYSEMPEKYFPFHDTTAYVYFDKAMLTK